ncbi:MFS transporter, partial [Leucobacter sp. M11]|uniref:MFS transporter n=1 Tax=Leucobacter sp. M11 TaxID=2993565 RepID=UPI002D7F9FAE
MIPNDPPPHTPAPAAQVRLVLVVVFLAYLGQMTLPPIIAPLARAAGLAEWQVGVTISTAALMVVLTSQFWGTRSQSWGRKPVLAVALAAATTSMACFATLAGLGIAGAITGAALFALFLLLRGVLFGGAIAAIAPTAQAFIANVTSTEAERVRGLAGVGAVQGIAMIGGSVVGGLLAGIGLMVSIWAVPGFLAVALVLVLVAMRREAASELLAAPVRVRARDPRVFPFLLAGFGLFTALGFIQILTGFIVQDRFGLSGETTGLVTGGALLAAGVGMVLAQTVIVPRSRISPPGLIRLGAPIALAGFG